MTHALLMCRSVNRQSHGGTKHTMPGYMRCSTTDPPPTKDWLIGHGNYEMTHLCYYPFNQKIIRTPHFRFYSSYSTVPSHSLSSSYRNVMGNLKVSDIHDIKLENSLTPFNSVDITCLTLPLPLEGIPLNIIFKDDHAFNLSYLYLANPRRKCRSILPKHLQSNT